MRLRVTQKLCTFHYSFCFSLQQIWLDWRKLLVESSTFVKPKNRFSVRPHWRNAMWQISEWIWNFVCENMTYHLLSKNNYDGSKRAYKCCQCFSWYKLNLIQVTNIYLKGRVLLKCFCSKNLDLFTLTIIHSIRESKETETPWGVTEDSKLCQAQTGQKTQKLSW